MQKYRICNELLLFVYGISITSQISQSPERFFHQSRLFEFFPNTTSGIYNFLFLDLKINYIESRRTKLNKIPSSFSTLSKSYNLFKQISILHKNQCTKYFWNKQSRSLTTPFCQALSKNRSKLLLSVRGLFFKIPCAGV